MGSGHRSARWGRGGERALAPVLAAVDLRERSPYRAEPKGLDPFVLDFSLCKG